MTWISGVITDTTVQLECRTPNKHGHRAQCQCPLKLVGYQTIPTSIVL